MFEYMNKKFNTPNARISAAVIKEIILNGFEKVSRICLNDLGGDCGLCWGICCGEDCGCCEGFGVCWFVDSIGGGSCVSTGVVIGVDGCEVWGALSEDCDSSGDWDCDSKGGSPESDEFI